MKPIQWKEEYNLDDAVIDEQHRKLLDLINDLLLAQKSNASRELVDKILHELSDYTIYHFSFEENWFERVDFENKVQHKKEHRDFIIRLETFHADFRRNEKNPMEMIQKMVAWLQEWLIDHILVTDREYVALLADKAD